MARNRRRADRKADDPNAQTADGTLIRAAAGGNTDGGGSVRDLVLGATTRRSSFSLRAPNVANWAVTQCERDRGRRCQAFASSLNWKNAVDPSVAVDTLVRVTYTDHHPVSCLEPRRLRRSLCAGDAPGSRPRQTVRSRLLSVVRGTTVRCGDGCARRQRPPRKAAAVVATGSGRAVVLRGPGTGPGRVRAAGQLVAASAARAKVPQERPTPSAPEAGRKHETRPQEEAQHRVVLDRRPRCRTRWVCFSVDFLFCWGEGEEHCELFGQWPHLRVKYQMPNRWGNGRWWTQ